MNRTITMKKIINLITITKKIKFRNYSHCIIRNRKKIIFLGTPEVAANSLEILINDFNSSLKYEIVAIVTQPPAPSGRNKKLLSSPVQLIAEKYNIPLFIPKKANEKSFLTNLEEIKPDLCITAAYGNYLPARFLNIPIYGTLNIHPSLLPKYRGAAPIQRCLEKGDDNIGVTLLFTEQSMDAGPIVKQIIRPLNGNEKAPEIMMELFTTGTNELIKILPSIFDGSIKDILVQQNNDNATSANKLSPLDSQVNFHANTAIEIHNKGRGYAGWPGIWALFQIGTAAEPLRIKIISTVVIDSISSSNNNNNNSNDYHVCEVSLVKFKHTDMLQIICKDGSILGITELQPLNKKIMTSRDFVNGLRGDKIKWQLI